MKPYSIFLSVILAVCVALLTSCKPSDTPIKKKDDTVKAAAKTALAIPKKELTPDQLTNKKLMGYNTIYHILIDSEDGVPGSYRILTKEILKAKDLSGMDFPVVTNLDKVLDSLRRNRATVGAGLGKLDLAAEELIAAGEKILAHEKSLSSYFNDEGYKKDEMEKFKQVSTDLEKDYTAVLVALSNFGMEIMKSKREISEKHKEIFKTSGDMVRYHTEEMVMLIEELLAIFDDPKVPFNRVVAFSKGNSIVEKLKVEIRAQRRAINDAKKEGKDSTYYDVVRSDVESVIADYRQVRDNRSQVAFDNMLKKYDKLVQDYNSAQMTVISKK